MEGGVECGRASDAQNPTRCKSLYPTRKSSAVAVVRANPTRKSNAVRHGLCYSGWARHVQLLP